MTRLLLMFLVLSPGIAQAVICKSVDAEGIVSYSDVPEQDCPTRVKIPGLSRPQAAPEQAGAPVAPPATPPVRQAPAEYISLQVTAPAQGETVRSNEGQVFIAVKAVPTLAQGHSLRLTLDGRIIPETFPSAAVELRNVQRGEHVLSVALVDAEGNELIVAEPVSFTLLSKPVVPPESPTT